MAKCVFIFLMALAYASAIEFTSDDGKLSCGTNSMTIDIDFDKFNDHKRKFKLHFAGSSDPACSVSSDEGADGSLVLSSNYDSCGINVDVKDGSIVYSQEVYVTYGVNPNSKKIFRVERITFDVECVKSADNVVPLAGAGHVNVSSLEEQTVAKSEEGEFDIKLTRTTDGSFTTEDSSSQMRLGDQMYFKLELNTIRDDLKLAPQTCYATNSKDSKDRYNLVENGCPNEADGTVKITETDSKRIFEWENAAFKFFGSSDAVYITCDVVVCEDSNQAEACQRCDKGAPRRRRAIVFGDVSLARRASVSSSLYKLV